MVDVSNEGVFSLRDVKVGCVVHFWIPNDKNLYEPGLGSKGTGDGDMAEKIEPAAGHSFVCNFSDAKEQLAAEPAQVSPPLYVAEVTVSYRSILGFRRYKKANFGDSEDSRRTYGLAATLTVFLPHGADLSFGVQMEAP